MGSGTQDCYMQALSARTPSYFTNKSLQAYWHATAAGKSSLSSISSHQLSVFSVAPECHPDHWNSTFDIQIPAPSFNPSFTCCPSDHLPFFCLHLALSTHLPLLSPVSLPLQMSSLVASSRAHCSPLSLAEFSVHNSSLHKCSSLNTACSPSASVPQLPLPFPCTALSWASYIPNGFKDSINFFLTTGSFFFTDNLILAQQECLYPANKFPTTLAYL